MKPPVDLLADHESYKLALSPEDSLIAGDYKIEISTPGVDIAGSYSYDYGTRRYYVTPTLKVSVTRLDNRPVKGRKKQVIYYLQHRVPQYLGSSGIRLLVHGWEADHVMLSLRVLPGAVVYRSVACDPKEPQ